MGIFRNSPDRALADAVSSRDKLASRLAETEIAIADCRNIAEKAALDGADDAALDAAEGRTRALVDRSHTLKAALARSEALVADLERARDEAADKKQREGTAAATELFARECIEAGAAVAAAVDRLRVVMVKAAPVAPEANGLAVFAEMAKREVPEGSALISRLLRQHREMVLAGLAPSTLKEPPQPFIEAVAVKPPTVQVFCLRPVKFKNAAGMQIVVQKFRDAEMPPEAATRGFALKACVEMTDPLRRQHHGTTPGHADAALALDLDESPSPEPERPSGEPHSAVVEFQQIDRGPPRLMQVMR